jgi:phosphatidylglycerophosphate synthase
VAVYLLRDFVILTISYMLFLNRDIVLESNFLGKLTTVMLLTTLVLYTVRLEEIGLPLVYLGTFLVAASGLIYARNFISLMRRMKNARIGAEAEVGSTH